jgi:hypothetical protein
VRSAGIAPPIGRRLQAPVHDAKLVSNPVDIPRATALHLR